MARPSNPQYNALRTQAMSAGGQDADLPIEDRRTRVTVVNGRPLTPGTDVTLVDIGPARVLGPGRGRNWFLAGWMEGTTPCYGTFGAKDIVNGS